MSVQKRFLESSGPHLVGASLSFVVYSLLWALVLLTLPIGADSLERLEQWFLSEHAAPIETLQFVLPYAIVPAAFFHVACLLVLVTACRKTQRQSLILLWYCSLAFATFTIEYAIWQIPWEWALSDFFVQLVLYQLAALTCAAFSVTPWLLVVALSRNRTRADVDGNRNTA